MVTSCCKAPLGQAGTGGLTGGWNEGDVAYYTGASHSLSSGDNLTYGDRGEVVGESLVYDGHDDKRVAIKFDGNDNPVACFVASLRPWPPPEELVTPGGDLGEFILALAAYLGQRSSSPEDLPTQEAVDRYLHMYLETVPAERPMIHCTDDRALRQLEDTLPAEGLDLRNPSGTVKRPDLLLALTKPENHGDLHIRLMLKQPEWYQLNAKLVPMVLRSFYGQLWQQNSKVDLRVLTGVSNPQAFFEVSSSQTCQDKGMAPMLTPRENGHSVLISHLDAVSLRRKDLANFFARIANATPRKVDKEQLHQRLDRHGWLALETTGSRIASGLPFYTLMYG